MEFRARALPPPNFNTKHTLHISRTSAQAENAQFDGVGKKDLKIPLTTEVLPLILSAREKVGLSIEAAQFLQVLGLQIEFDLVPSPSHACRAFVRNGLRPEATMSFLFSEIWRKPFFENLILEFPPTSRSPLLVQGSRTDGKFGTVNSLRYPPERS